jgi:hypothetical protein
VVEARQKDPSKPPNPSRFTFLVCPPFPRATGSLCPCLFLSRLSLCLGFYPSSPPSAVFLLEPSSTLSSTHNMMSCVWWWFLDMVSSVCTKKAYVSPHPLLGRSFSFPIHLLSVELSFVPLYLSPTLSPSICQPNPL